jgi:hypothetical protein
LYSPLSLWERGLGERRRMLLANFRKASYSQYTIVASDLDMFKRKGQKTDA